jgi:hypothetical protein
MIAYLTMVITWPYLWENPIGKFIEVVRFMADNPTQLRVLFYGQLYPADQLPLRYLPSLMLFTLTEPVFPLAALGAILATVRFFRRTIEWKSLLVISGWLFIPLVYVLVKRPPMYDGFRHFLFIIPPLFIFAGITFDVIKSTINSRWIQAILLLVVLVPGILQSFYLHPYQYTYYNQYVGGTGEAAYRFETDYWLTCYKEAVEELLPYTKEDTILHVRREYLIASYYAPKELSVKDYQNSKKTIKPGDFVLMNSRANPSLQRYRNPNQAVLRVGRDGALFCVTQRR